MNDQPAVLLGGPRHGRETRTAGSRFINVPEAPPPPVFLETPKRTWLDRLLRRPVPAPPQPDLTFKTYHYERYGTRDDGALIYLCREDADLAQACTGLADLLHDVQDVRRLKLSPVPDPDARDTTGGGTP